jgi:mono/diheme cytochrome c family protein
MRALEIFCAIGMGLSAVALAAQGPGKTREITIRDGVYTTAQAASGKAVYATQCSLCHLDNLAGGGNESPALRGDAFISDFEGKPLRSFYSRIISTMPSSDPGSLSDKETLNLVAYILQQNGFPAGKKALGPPDALNKIQFIRVK